MSDALLSVLLIDDHTLFRKGLAELLEQRGAIRVAGMTGSHDEAMRLLQEEKPDVVIVDLNMPPLGGLTLWWRRRRNDGSGSPDLMRTSSGPVRTTVTRSGVRPSTATASGDVCGRHSIPDSSSVAVSP